MLFNSLDFFIFFPIVTALYFAVAHRLRWAVLLAASCWFYAAFVPKYLLILGFTIAVDYVAGILIEGAETPHRKKVYLALSIVANVGVLVFFKYWNFFTETATSTCQLFGVAWPLPRLSILLPIGLSFHTFQAMSYTIEVYRGAQRAERHLGVYALYVMFYPQLVAGPIERPQNILHQLHEEHRFEPADVSAGLRYILLGFVKKSIVADRLSAVVDHAFGAPAELTGPALAIGTFAFAFQIYADFSGYSDIAIGTARVMGIRLMRNFNHPYLAASIGEFWRRWHISLSTWFRDYLYLPLGGNRVSFPRWQTNLLITFVVSGLWHGANWTFIAWGAINGIYLVLANVRDRVFGRRAEATGLRRIFGMIVTFVLTCIAWVFFRARTMADAFAVLKGIAVGLPLFASPRAVRASLAQAGLSPRDVFVTLALAGGLFAFDALAERGPTWLDARPRWQRWGIFYLATVAVLLFARFGDQQFIYFQF